VFPDQTAAPRTSEYTAIFLAGSAPVRPGRVVVD
jgi:hypothetical protein